jgi:hypothetical protein
MGVNTYFTLCFVHYSPRWKSLHEDWEVLVAVYMRDCCLLGCGGEQSDKNKPKFRRDLLFPTSGYKYTYMNILNIRINILKTKLL